MLSQQARIRIRRLISSTLTEFHNPRNRFFHESQALSHLPPRLVIRPIHIGHFDDWFSGLLAEDGVGSTAKCR